MKLLGKIGLAAAVAGALLVPAAKADAASNCVNIGYTRQGGNTISGYGSIPTSCGGSASLIIQRSRWWGWEDMSSTTVSGSGYDQYVYYNCAGTGVHDFRTLITARHLDGSYDTKSSNVITANCGG